MDLEKRYEADGLKYNILEMVKKEPEWAAVRIQQGEQAEKELLESKQSLKVLLQLLQKLT